MQNMLMYYKKILFNKFVLLIYLKYKNRIFKEIR